jgi:cell division protein FtsB
MLQLDHEVLLNNAMSATPAPNPQKKRPTARAPASLQVMFAAIIAIALILAINFTSRIAAGQPLQLTYDEVSAEIERLRQEQAALIEERDFVQGDAYVEGWARDEGKLIRPGEVLYVPVPALGEVTEAPVEVQTVTIETSPPQPDPWQVWWQLFFDSTPPEF